MPPLEREINLTATNETVGAVLNKIAGQSGVTFSYSPSVVNSQKTISIKAKDKSVREVLALVLDEGIAYKQSGKYIILTKAPNPGKKVTVSGYVYDKTSGKKVANTSVYDPNTMTSSISNQYGYYELEVPKESKVKLAVNKAEYADTTIALAPIRNQLVEIAIQPAPPPVEVIDTAKRNPLKEAGLTFFRNARAFINTINIKDTIHRGFQLSFVPYIGTNHKLSANVINRASINVLGGYSMGTYGFEVGGIFNINRKSSQGFQSAGIFNIVGGNYKGFQAAGILNIVKGSVAGFQAGGLFNHVGSNSTGFQAAGLLNSVGGTSGGFRAAGLTNYVNGQATGFGAAGLFNIHGQNATGFTTAGLANITAGTHTGASTAGLFNYSHIHKHGAQIAGLFNYADSIDGAVQIAGLLNMSFRRSGPAQISGLINVARTVTGLQLALINIADTCESGVSLGLISFVRKGVHQFELSVDEMLFGSLHFRTGSRGLHNIIGAGINLTDTQSPLWAITYGLGTSIRMGKRASFDIDLAYNHLSQGSFNTNVNFLNRLYIGPEFTIAKWFKIAVGPTVNLFLSDATQANYAAFEKLVPYSFSNYTAISNNVNIKWWVGGKLAIRFL